MRVEVDGRQAFVATGGKTFDAEQPTVVFLHGSALDHSFWGLYTRFFAFRGCGVLAPDFPGHTHSEPPPLATIEAMADWLEALLCAVSAGPVSLVGHSQGVLVALEFARRHPRRPRSLSLIASGLATPVNRALIEAAEQEPERAVDMMIAWGFGSAGHLHRGAIPGGSMMGGGARVMRRNAPTALATDLRACDAYGRGREAAAAVTCPAQVLIAGKDRMAPRKATAALVEALDGPEVHLFEECGHMLPLEAPDRCRAMLRDFVFRHGPAD